MKNASKLSDTDLCVMCAMCLPQCPTYQLYQNETESPRGRIALMQAIDQGRIKADATALLHIDHCLSCLNCETICPSRVPYAKLIDEFRDQHSNAIKKPLAAKIILRQSATTHGITALGAFLSHPLIKPLTHLATFIADMVGRPFLNPFTQPPVKFKSVYRGDYSAASDCRGEVSLFTGCSGASLDYQTINDAISILKRLKFDVYIDENQSCCGALHQHNGQKQTAKQLLDSNFTQLQSQNKSTVLFFSPACGDRLMQADNINIVDARHFILNALQQHPLVFSAPLRAVALHESCSHRNMLKLKNLNRDLLHCVAGLHIVESSNPALCCGAAGIQSINYPQQAHALLQGKLKSFDLTQVNILISDNIGCSLQIKSAISAYNPDVEIMHPISFLARHLTTKHEPD